MQKMKTKLSNLRFTKYGFNDLKIFSSSVLSPAKVLRNMFLKHCYMPGLSNMKLLKYVINYEKILL